MTTPLHITTEDPPVYTPYRKIHGEKKMQVEEQLGQWEEEKVIERCDSNWASPMHAVMKPDGSWRVCGDFRRLNAMTKLDRYPLPALTTFNERLAWCSVFSKIYLWQAFQQVHVDEGSQDKTAIITTLSLFKFLRMPYGLKNAAQCFQCNVHQLLSDMRFAHFLYMDDFIVGSKCKEDHFRLTMPLPETQRQGASVSTWRAVANVPRTCRRFTWNFNSNIENGSNQTVSSANHSQGTRAVFGNLCVFPLLCVTRVWENGTANSTQERIPPKGF